MANERTADLRSAKILGVKLRGTTVQAPRGPFATMVAAVLAFSRVIVMKAGTKCGALFKLEFCHFLQLPAAKAL